MPLPDPLLRFRQTVTAGNSLTRRLMFTTLAWVIVTLSTASILLVHIYFNQVTEEFDRILEDHLMELIAVTTPHADGSITVSWQPIFPPFNSEGSPWFWQIRHNETIVAGSETLGAINPALLNEKESSTPHGFVVEFNTPDGVYLRAMSYKPTLLPHDGNYHFIVAGPVDEIASKTDALAVTMGSTFGLLALGLLILVPLQIQYGLNPLGRLQERMVRIREGKSNTLEGTFPIEVQPLVDELNRLIEYNRSLVIRARKESGDLAHALKGPIAVMRNCSTRVENDALRDALKLEIHHITDTIEHRLVRARRTGSLHLLGARTELDQVADDLLFTMEKLFAHKRLSISGEGFADYALRCEPEEIEEILGNLLDNACKWATSTVAISCGKDPEGLWILVEDDGPGIPPSEWETVCTRGRRLDETTPGSGLGLDIVKNLIDSYGGALTLEHPGMGGTSILVRLPATLIIL
ncbi:MAG: sensor histidine kinase [Magnetococcales bacterium]|nr:sensor histidine kinase [Magnetococcales bacterium]